MAPSLMTSREAAQRARVHHETFKRLCREGRGPALTLVGRKALIREDLFAEWIDASTQQSAPTSSHAHAAE